LLTPLQIVQALSGTGVANLGVVKNFLAETIEKERREIENVSLSPEEKANCRIGN